LEKCIVVLNKTDLGNAVRPEQISNMTTVQTSLVNGEGVDKVRQLISEHIFSGIKASGPPHATISERHRKLLLNARSEIDEALSLIRDKSDYVVLAADRIREALELVGIVTGKVYQDELLASIFSRFCIGK
jgi:tRNA modification GTPase